MTRSDTTCPPPSIVTPLQTLSLYQPIGVNVLPFMSISEVKRKHDRTTVESQFCCVSAVIAIFSIPSASATRYGSSREPLPSYKYRQIACRETTPSSVCSYSVSDSVAFR